jgi:hypothetical protein
MKRITLDIVGWQHTWKATSHRYGVSAYGRTVTEAKQRLFVTVEAHRRNLYAAVSCHPGL